MTATATAPARAPRPTPRRDSAAAPAPARRPELYVVDAPSRKVRTSAVFAVATVVVFGALLTAASFHSLLVSGQVRLDDLNRQIRVEQEELQNNRLALASSQSPERIALEASRLGLVPADRQTWINPSTDSSVVVNGDKSSPATGSDAKSPRSPTAESNTQEMAVARSGDATGGAE